MKSTQHQNQRRRMFKERLALQARRGAAARINVKISCRIAVSRGTSNARSRHSRRCGDAARTLAGGACTLRHAGGASRCMPAVHHQPRYGRIFCTLSSGAVPWWHHIALRDHQRMPHGVWVIGVRPRSASCARDALRENLFRHDMVSGVRGAALYGTHRTRIAQPRAYFLRHT